MNVPNDDLMVAVVAQWKREPDCPCALCVEVARMARGLYTARGGSITDIRTRVDITNLDGGRLTDALARRQVP